MAYWTQEGVLDLSKSTTNSHPVSPRDIVKVGDCSPPFSGYHRHYSFWSVEQSLPASEPYFTGYPYPRTNHIVSSAQISPDSVTSAYKASSPTASVELYDTDSLSGDEEYQTFARDALKAMAEKNGGCLLGNNPRMRRAVQTSQGVKSDDSYCRQRERNNIAAKRSRDRRKLREVQLALQVTFLKKKMADLQARVAARICIPCQKVHKC